MTSGYQVVIDACVLVNAALRDTLLRLAEPPHLYLPRWSKQLIGETTRTLESKLGCTRAQTERLVHELSTHFADAWVEGYEPLIAAMDNHPKDRHVLAAAVKTGAQTIVTFNLKHFPREVLAAWSVQAQSPDAFLIDQYYLDPHLVMSKVQEQAAKRRGFDSLLKVHEVTVPEFVRLLRAHSSKS